MDTFGDRLREARKALGLSQAEFAEIGGVQKRAQINYEADERRPDSAYLIAIAERGVDVLFLLTGSPAGVHRKLGSIARVRDLLQEMQVPKDMGGQLMPELLKLLDIPELDAQERELVDRYRLCAADGQAMIRQLAETLAGTTTHAKAPPPEKPPNASKVQIHGDVGQVVQAEGDIRNKKQTFNVGTRKGK